MRHVSVEAILNYLEGRLSASDRVGLEKHLATQCADCTELTEDFRNLVKRLKAEAAVEPPQELVEWGVNLFQPLIRPQEVGVLRKIIACLVFDTYEQPMMAGVRHVGTAPRQLVFKAGDVDVDVKIESMESQDRVTLFGQVLSSTPKFFDNTPVWLESHGVVRYRTRTDVLGEFSFDEIPKDTYHLCLGLPEGQITLFCVNRGNL